MWAQFVVLYYVYIWWFSDLGAEPRALGMSGKHSSIQLYPQHSIRTRVCEGWRAEGLEFAQLLPANFSSHLHLNMFLPVTFLL